MLSSTIQQNSESFAKQLIQKADKALDFQSETYLRKAAESILQTTSYTVISVASLVGAVVLSALAVVTASTLGAVSQRAQDGIVKPLFKEAAGAADAASKAFSSALTKTEKQPKIIEDESAVDSTKSKPTWKEWAQENITVAKEKFAEAKESKQAKQALAFYNDHKTAIHRTAVVLAVGTTYYGITSYMGVSPLNSLKDSAANLFKKAEGGTTGGTTGGANRTNGTCGTTGGTTGTNSTGYQFVESLSNGATYLKDRAVKTLSEKEVLNLENHIHAGGYGAIIGRGFMPMATSSRNAQIFTVAASYAAAFALDPNVGIDKKAARFAANKFSENSTPIQSALLWAGVGGLFTYTSNWNQWKKATAAFYGLGLAFHTFTSIEWSKDLPPLRNALNLLAEKKELSYSSAYYQNQSSFKK